MECPENMVYSYSAPTCPETCSNPDAEEECDDAVRVREGCVCEEGFILSGDSCVPEEQCGCKINRRYFEVRFYWELLKPRIGNCTVRLILK